jgi:hypothetical protein
MPSRRVLWSVAHNVADSFLSRNNDADGYWALAFLLERALAAGEWSFTIDCVSLDVSAAFESEPLSSLPTRYRTMFWEQVGGQCIPPERVGQALIQVEFDLERSRPSAQHPDLLEYPVSCQVRIVDDRGKVYAGRRECWCFPHCPEVTLKSARA